MAISWFRRDRDSIMRPDSSTEGDSPAELTAAVWQVIGFVNSNAGRMPAETVVQSRAIADVLLEIIATDNIRPLEIQAVISVKSIAGDYLPTTLRTFLAVDHGSWDEPRQDGRRPRELVTEQLESLWTAAADVLAATEAQDSDALATQGNFLRTKFSQSDLAL